MLNAMHALDVGTLHWQVQVKPEEAEKFLSDAGDKLAHNFVVLANSRMPKAKWGTSEHWFKIGREYSRVVYLEMVKTYVRDFTRGQWAAVLGDLETFAKIAEADEFNVEQNDEVWLKIRVWWD
jgi:hypothetical protein